MRLTVMIWPTQLDAEHKALLHTVTQASKGPDDFATLASNVRSKPLDMPSLRLTLGDSNAETCVVGFEALKTFLSQFATLMEISKTIMAAAPAPTQTNRPHGQTSGKHCSTRSCVTAFVPPGTSRCFAVSGRNGSNCPGRGIW